MKNTLRIAIAFLLSAVLCLCLGAAAFAEDTWSPSPDGEFHTVTLDANGGYFDNDRTNTEKKCQVLEGWDLNCPIPTNPDPHLAFSGWYYDEACTEPAAGPDEGFVPYSDVTLYAGWSEGWLVTFEAGDGQFDDEAATTAVAVVKGKPLDQYPYPYAKSPESYIWFDYYTLEDGTRVEACSGLSFGHLSYSPTFIPEGDVTLYAHYSRFYNVTFDANGGYFYDDPDRLTMDIRIAESSASDAFWFEPTNPDTDLKFTGWYYDAACTDLAAAPWGSFTTRRDMTLYAGWAKAYTVSYDANGGEGAPAAQTKASGEAMLLSWEAPRREGFYFLGWSEDPNADKAAYLPGESFTEDTDTTLYALWGNPDFVLPETLTQIGEEAFTDTAARFVKLPDSTESVGPRAFAACTELDYIVIPDYLNQIDFSAFDDTQDVIVLTFSQFGRLYRLADYMRMMAP